MNIFLSISLICFGCSEEPSHKDGSFEYPEKMFWLTNKKNAPYISGNYYLNLQANSADPYRRLHNGASDQGLHHLLTVVMTQELIRLSH